MGKRKKKIRYNNFPLCCKAEEEVITRDTDLSAGAPEVYRALRVPYRFDVPEKNNEKIIKPRVPQYYL